MSINLFEDFVFSNFSSDTPVSRKLLSENNIEKYEAVSIVSPERFKIDVSINNIKEIDLINFEENKIVKPVNIQNFSFKIYDCSENLDTPLPLPIGPIPSIPTPIILPPTYLFSGVNPVNGQVEIWYDTNRNSKGPSGKIYLQVGVIEEDSSIL